MTLREFRNSWKNNTLCDVTSLAYGIKNKEYYSFANRVYRKRICDDSAFPEYLLDEEVSSILLGQENGEPLLLIDTIEYVQSR